MGSQNILGRCVAIGQINQGERFVWRRVDGRCHPKVLQFRQTQTRGHARGYGGLSAEWVRDLGRVVRGTPRLPAVVRQEASDAANRVGRAGAQSNLAVTVEIDAVVTNTAGHELRQALGACKGTVWVEGVCLGVTHQHEELLQLLPKIAATTRLFESQGGEHVNDAKLSKVPAIKGFDADN
jgi:hypothetical protein